MTVFLIEDDKAVADSVAMTISSLGHEVKVFGDGESFLGKAAPKPEDTVFVDLKLPGISGRTVMDELCRREEGLRLVAISGESRRKIDLELSGMEWIPVLRKPLSTSTISQSI